MGQYVNELYVQNASLQCENKALRQQIEEFKSGKRYLKLQDDNARISAGYRRIIKKLKGLVVKTQNQAAKDRDMWIEQGDHDWEWYQAELGKKDKEIQRLEERYWATVRANDAKILELTKDYENQLNKQSEQMKEKDAIIEELKAKVACQEALLHRDGTNTGTPTSQTKPGKKKHIPNGRTKSDKKKGGQEGHEQHLLQPPSDEEINDTVEHKLDETDTCPSCGSSDLRYTGNFEKDYEFDVKIQVIKRCHIYFQYECMNCGEIVVSAEGPDFRWSKCVYGPGIQAMALSLMNTVNAPMNKASLFIAGLSNNVLAPCEGYMAKIQMRAAKALDGFYEDLRLKVIGLPIVYWDDTVISINTMRACFRFYGDESVAFYTAHEKKDLPGILEDNVLPMLTSDTSVMHDHNTVNYNPKFHFQNLECDQHLERDAQKNSDDTGHMWSTDMKKLIATTIMDRNIAAENGVERFSDSYIKAFNFELDEILRLGWQEYKADAEKLKKYGASFEKALLVRMQKYRDNYFAWLTDFSLPTTNNLSERSLRSLKSKMKISGQYESLEYAKGFARIRSYTETCYRRGKNPYDALTRLMAGEPYTVAELFS